jgi:hypothetical protein
MVGSLGRSEAFKLRSRGPRQAQIQPSKPPEAPDRPQPRRVAFNQICLVCSAAARISPSAAQIRRRRDACPPIR